MAGKSRREGRIIRHRRVRRKIRGAESRPRVAVFRSLRHISGQAIDDLSGRTLVSITTASKDFGAKVKKTSNLAAAAEAGKAMGSKLKEAGISEAVFDRGGYLYHGRVKAFAEGIREAGVKI